MHAANLKPGKSGDMKVGWSALDFIPKIQDRNFFFLHILQSYWRASEPLQRLQRKLEVLPTKHSKHSKENRGRKAVALSSRFPIFVCFECFVGINFLPSGRPNLPGCHPVSKPPGLSEFRATARNEMVFLHNPLRFRVHWCPFLVSFSFLPGPGPGFVRAIPVPPYGPAPVTTFKRANFSGVPGVGARL